MNKEKDLDQEYLKVSLVVKVYFTWYDKPEYYVYEVTDKGPGQSKGKKIYYQCEVIRKIVVTYPKRNCK